MAGLSIKRKRAIRRTVNKLSRQGLKYLRTVNGRKLAKSTIAAYKISRRIRNARTRNRKRKSRKAIRANASGTTSTSLKMIVRKTPKQQRFMRRLFRTNPTKIMHVNRYGFAWMGATAASKTIWYSCCNLKYNNILDYFKKRIIHTAQSLGQSSSTAGEAQQVGNNPLSTIYIGKCIYQYELYNPTNYYVTVYVYDLICRHDTPHAIIYNAADNDYNSSPEACMRNGSMSHHSSDTNPYWVIGDPTWENNSYWNNVGVKPTDYYEFNIFWKVKGFKKLILPPGSVHHHTVVFNPKARLTLGKFIYPRITVTTASNKPGVAGLTQATLFGFEGQVAVSNDTTSDSTTAVGTLPGKIVVKLVRKENVYNFPLNAELLYSSTSLATAFGSNNANAHIFTDLSEQTAGAV